MFQPRVKSSIRTDTNNQHWASQNVHTWIQTMNGLMWMTRTEIQQTEHTPQLPRSSGHHSKQIWLSCHGYFLEKKINVNAIKKNDEGKLKNIKLLVATWSLTMNARDFRQYKRKKKNQLMLWTLMRYISSNMYHKEVNTVFQNTIYYYSCMSWWAFCLSLDWIWSAESCLGNLTSKTVETILSTDRLLV